MDKSFKFKKKYGQNFLTNKKLIVDMVNTVSLTKDDLVIEIGPGGGVLTEELLKKTKVLAYEIDLDLKEELKEKFKDKELKIIFDDFLKRNIKKDIDEINYKKLYVISNIPYYITTPIILKIIEEKIEVEKIVIMVQKELGERFTATPGSRDYGSISVLLNYYFDLRKCFVVGRNNFVPRPKVDSVVISLTKKEKEKIDNEELFFKLIRDAFRFKRKTIRNNLKDYDLEKIEQVLKKYNYDLTVRSEKLDYKIFVEIANALNK